MIFRVSFFVLIFCIAKISCVDEKPPSVLIISLIRNKAHTLPYFFSFLENLNYPKDRISLFLRSDHNEDNSIEIIETFLNHSSEKYHSVNFKGKSTALVNGTHFNQKSVADWTIERFLHVIKLKQEGLDYGRKIWADFVFFLDCDVLLSYEDTLMELVELNLPVVAPMLLSDALYSNFWGGMYDDYYYKRTEEYKEILHYKKIGQFRVPMVHTAVLVKLNSFSSDSITFEKSKIKDVEAQRPFPLDDIIIFAVSCNNSGIPMYISNEKTYGYILAPMSVDEDLERDNDQLTNLKTLIINYSETGLLLKQEYEKYVSYPKKDKMDFSNIYLINLARRTERKLKMDKNLNELGIDVEYFPAVDGKNLTDEVLEKLGVQFMPGYVDPYSKRPMTLGEIGCFLSHYYIWQKMVESNEQEVLILEDDIKFEPFFKERAVALMKDAHLVSNWDLIYFGRKRLQESDESSIPESEYLVRAGYSYWTLGYVLSLEGAKKLLAAKPLEKLIPVDEFLPVMFDKHTNETWLESYENRNLIALSARPLLLHPTHYTGEYGYISDTEDSALIKSEDSDADKKGDKEDPAIEQLMDERRFKHDLLLNSYKEKLGLKESSEL